MSTYDLFVIGAGSGGLAAAKRAAAHGAKVALAENDLVGGTCVIRGCVPKKIMSYAAGYAESMHDAVGYGFNMPEIPFDFGAFATKRNTEIDRLNKLHIKLLNDANVELISGHASIESPKTVRIGEKTYEAKHIIIATGGTPTKLPIPGAEFAITSDGVWSLNHLPEKMIIIGGGYIGVEFAGIFNALGCEVHMLIRKDTLLSTFDDDIRHTLQAEMEKRGVIFHCGCEAAQIEQVDHGQLCLETTSGERINVETVLMATGRKPNTGGIGLEKIGLATDERGALPVTPSLQTEIETIYAIGDVTNRVNLTPVAVRDGRMVAENLFNNQSLTFDDTDIATAVFSLPGVGTVGLTEASAKEKFGDNAVHSHTETFKPMIHTLSGREEKNMMKIVEHTPDRRVLGCHVVGRDAAEIIQGFAVAVKMGATIDDFRRTVAIHPSSAEELVLMG